MNRETTPWKSRYVTREVGLDLTFLLLSPPVPIRRFVALQDLGGRILRCTRGPLALPEELENSGLAPLLRADVRGAALARWRSGGLRDWEPLARGSGCCCSGGSEGDRDAFMR